MTSKLRNMAAIAIMAVGSLQMFSHFTGSRIQKGIGLASGIAPYPKVFCEAGGYEAFAADFLIEGERDGMPWSRRLDPDWYSKLEGPYNRRNVYGAALAFAPRLPEDLRRNLMNEALAPGSRMRSELGIPPEVTGLKVIITPRAGETGGPWAYQTETL